MNDIKEFLWLKASIHYHTAGKRFSRIRERFWNRFTKLMKAKDYDKAELCIDAFIAIRKR